VFGIRRLRHVFTDVFEALVLNWGLKPCLEVDVKAVQRPSIEIYHVKKRLDIDHCMASHGGSDVTKSMC